MDDFKFEIEEKPTWRKDRTLTTTKIVKEVVEMSNAYRDKNEEEKSFCEHQFMRCMASDYVYHSTSDENLGTDSFERTSEIVISVLDGRPVDAQSRPEKETLNTARALAMTLKLGKDAPETGTITMEQVCELHHLLMSGLHPEAGKLRSSEAFTLLSTDAFHFYPPPAVAAMGLYEIIDRHNIHMEAYALTKNNKTVGENFTFLVKECSWLIFNLVNNHPFAQGNGLMCRLLANYVLSTFVPMPVHLCGHRDDYLCAVVRCRNNPKEGPKELAAMLIEGVWRGFKYLFQSLDAREHFTFFEEQLGPVAVQKSKIKDPKATQEKIKRACSVDASIPLDEVMETVFNAIDQVDVSKLELHQYKHTLVPIDDTRYLSLNVFP